MDMTQQDFEARKARIDDGTADDEDRRLVKQYTEAGFVPGGKPPEQDRPAAEHGRAAVDGGLRQDRDHADGSADNDDKGPARTRPANKR